MTENDAIQVAPRSSIANPSTIGDEWVVLFAFHEDDETGYSSAALAIVVIDDATGQANLLDSL